MSKIIAVFFGGRSTEHDISIISALAAVIKPLEMSGKYKVVPVYIAKDGKWFSDKKFKDISTFRDKTIDELCDKLKPISVVFDGGMTLRTGGLTNKDIHIDIAFPVMHGSYGEDGSLMGLFRMVGIPFVGTDMAASTVAMDKILSKQIAEANGILTPKYVFFSKFDYERDPIAAVKKTIENLVFPMFVKPPHLGSSIGIAKVNNENELSNALEVAAYYDNKILVEEAVNNLIEVTVPIMGNEVLRPALVEKALFKSDEFFDFDTKYISGGKKGGGKKGGTKGSQGYSELPAQLPEGLYEKALEVAQNVYRAIGCEGISRIDLLIDSNSQKVYFNEVNPMPGDLYVHNWRASGVSSVDLVCRLVELAEERYENNKKLETTFSSSFLKQF